MPKYWAVKRWKGGNGVLKGHSTHLSGHIRVYEEANIPVVLVTKIDSKI
jgi:hypothetical protein